MQFAYYIICSQNSCTYKLQEETVGDQLFQDSGDGDLTWTSDALLSFLKVHTFFPLFIQLSYISDFSFISRMMP